MTMTVNSGVTVLVKAIGNWISGAKVVPVKGPIGPIGTTGPIGITGPRGMVGGSVGPTGPRGVCGGGAGGSGGGGSFISSGQIIIGGVIGYGGGGGGLIGYGGGGLTIGSSVSPYYMHHNALETLYDKTLADNFIEIEITEESSATLQEINGRMVVSLYMSLSVEGIIGLKDFTDPQKRITKRVVSVDEIDSEPYFVILENNDTTYITNGEKYYMSTYQLQGSTNIRKLLARDMATLINGVIQQYKDHLRKHFG